MYAVYLPTGNFQMSVEPSGLEGEIEFDSLPEGEGPLYIEGGVLKRVEVVAREVEEQLQPKYEFERLLDSIIS